MGFLLPLGVLLGGCQAYAARVEVRNHTDRAVWARDLGADEEIGDQVRVPAHAARTLEVVVSWTDATVEVETEAGLRHAYDLDLQPWEHPEVLDVHDADFTPAGNG